MASRENQGLQIALILFVLVTAALAVTTYVYFRKSQEEYERAQSAIAKKETADKNLRKTVDDNIKLKKMIGHPIEENMEQIEKAFALDMLKFGETFPEANRNYRALPEYLVAAIRERNVQVADATDREKKLIAEKTSIRNEEHALVVKANEGLQRHVTDLAQERGLFKTELAKNTGVMTKIRTDFDTVRKKTAADTAEKDQEIKELAKELAKVEKLREAAVEKLTERKSRRNTFEKPAGKITWVKPGGDMVWINLGRGDALRPQINFSVHESDTTNVVNSQKKGSIEVTRVIDTHLAEARIIDDDNLNPILPGDKVYSPIWKPGRQIHFALAGLMDIDGDKKSDRKQIRNLILSSSGVIDAEVDDDGKRTGRVTINTRYLVLGDRPTEKTATESITAYSNIQKEARDVGVEMISVDKLLDLMGYEGARGTVSLSRGARSEDFKAKPEGGVIRKSTGSTSEEFRERRPPARKSAY